MTPYEVLEKLEIAASRIRTEIPAVVQIAHLNDLMPDEVPVTTDPQAAQDFVDGFLVKALNYLAAQKGCHYTVRVEHLKRRRQK